MSVRVLKFFEKENRGLTALFPPVGLGYLYYKDGAAVCTQAFGLIDWRFTGMPALGYLLLTVLTIVTASITLELELADKVPLATRESRFVNVAVEFHGIADFLMLIPLAANLCDKDLLIWSLFFLTVLLWTTKFAKRIFIDRIQDGL